LTRHQQVSTLTVWATSNLSVFGKGQKKDKGAPGEGGPPPELQLFSFSHLELKIDDRQRRKLFYFTVNTINGRMSSTGAGLQANFHLDVLAKSMAFKTSHGKLYPNKTVSGELTAHGYDDGKIAVRSDALSIGPNLFKLDAVFGANKRPADFTIHLVCDQISWRQASDLVSANIKLKLDRYDISKPLVVSARITGSFAGGDPFLYIIALVRDSKVTTPAAVLDNCSFNGIFTNNFENGKGFSDDIRSSGSLS